MATKIICRATDCIFWEDKICTSEEIIYDPEEGCLTYEVLDDLVDLGEDEEEWEDDELIDDDEEDEELAWDDDEDEDLFLDDDIEAEDDDRDWRL
ncbi:MAG: hypothetical protein KJ077_44940 [Anaerolineae bacterium]|jgi:hypothetical protein|nr:hypothetical protein [Anaerolineae bacterium]GIK41079.1 MAG: hypothetical protein BroJett011_49120 [Chloroflexota bacterium]